MGKGLGASPMHPPSNLALQSTTTSPSNLALQSTTTSTITQLFMSIFSYTKTTLQKVMNKPHDYYLFQNLKSDYCGDRYS